MNIFKTKEGVTNWLESKNIMGFTVHDNLVVDVSDSVDLADEELTEIPIQFGKVDGYFDCNSNKLTSLKGCPYEVGGFFDCSQNKLTDLKAGPNLVGTVYDCSHNSLTSLEGCAESLTANFYCESNQLRDLKFAPKIFQYTFNCSYNPIETILDLDLSEGCTDAELFHNGRQPIPLLKDLYKADKNGDNVIYILSISVNFLRKIIMHERLQLEMESKEKNSTVSNRKSKL